MLSYIFLPGWRIKEEDVVWLKVSSQTPAGLNCLLADGDTKEGSEAGGAQSHISFI